MAAVLRRAELFGRLTPARAGIAITRLLAAPLRRVEVQPLLSDAAALVVAVAYLRAEADRVLRAAPGAE